MDRDEISDGIENIISLRDKKCETQNWLNYSPERLSILKKRNKLIFLRE